MIVMFIPIDVEALSRRALRGYGPEDPEPLPPRERWLTRVRRRQPTARPRWTGVAPDSSRSRASGCSVPSSAR
jgi:hypothetical protein